MLSPIIWSPATLTHGHAFALATPSFLCSQLVYNWHTYYTQKYVMPVIDALLMSWAHTFATTATNIGAAALPGPSAASSGVSATALRLSLIHI